MGFTIRGFIWDIPVLIVAYVLFSGLRSISPGEGSGFPLKIPHLKQAERWVAVTLNLDLKNPTHRLHSSSFLGLLYRISKYEPPRGTTMEPMGKPENVAGPLAG